MDPKRSIQPRLEKVTGQLEESYLAYQRIHHITTKFLPSRDEVGVLVDQLFALMYPGFFGRQDLDRETIRDHLAEEVEEISNRLYRQVYQCFRCRGELDESELEGHSRAVTMHFLEQLPRVRELLASDVLAAYTGDPAAADTDEVIFSYPATLAIGTYRLAHELWLQKAPYMPRMMTERAHSMTGIDIHPGAQIGRGFFIDHGTGVVIGETTVIGENCKLYQGVTLGAPSFPHDEAGQIQRNYKRHPTLEDEVVVYSNASILGDVTIGRGATIGGSVFLTRSVPPGCRVSAKPAELKYRNQRPGLDRGYVSDWQI